MTHNWRILVLLLAIGLAACSGQPKRGTNPFPDGKISATSAEAQAKFDAAKTKLEAGEWRAAQEAFRLLQAEHPNDAISTVAELYVARAGLENLDALISSAPIAPAAAPAESLRLFTQLEADSGVDARIRYTAQLYRAAALAATGDRASGIAALKEYPSVVVTPLTLERDQTAVGVLIATAHTEHDRAAESIAAWASVYERSDDPEIGLLARSRAFDTVAQAEDDVLQEMTTDKESAFIRAVAGWEWVRRRLAATPVDEEREALEALHQRVSVDLVAIGESARATEHGAALATWGPVRKLVIGAVLPLSGPQEGVGRRAAESMMVAQQAVVAGGEPNVTLIVVDSNRPPEEVFTTLYEAGAVAVIGPLDNNKTALFAPHARAAKIPMLSLSPTSLESVEGAGEWVFRFFVDAIEEARAVARIAATEHQDRRAAIVFPDIGYGRAMAKAFREAFEAEGGTIVIERSYDPAKSDYASVARAVAGAKPDSVFLPGRPSKVAEVASFLAQANVWGIPRTERPSPKSQRIQVHYLGTSFWTDEAIVKQAGSYLRGALIPSWSSPLYEDATGVRFHARFRAAAGREAELLDAVIADAVLLGRVLMLERGVSRPEAFRDTIRAPRVYDGVAGSVGFSGNGEPIRVLRFITVDEGAFKATDVTATTGPSPSSESVN